MENQSGFENYVAVYTMVKRHNIGTFSQNVTAFGVLKVILVGHRDFNAFSSYGSTSYLRFRHSYSLSDVYLFLNVSLKP
ncbi:hypothetical protein CsSME_00027786 [Camellia sinensis var. sinensis]